MQTCWAHSLGNCAGGISREHYVSKSLFPDGKVTIAGFKWLNGEHKTFQVQSIGANILCRYHNTALSELDAEIDNFGQILDNIEINKSFLKRLNAISVKPNSHLINGNLLEWWLAKTITGLFVAATKEQINESWDMNGKPSYEPPIEIVKSIFGLNLFPSPLGVYFINSDYRGNNLNGVTTELLWCEDNGNVTGLVGATVEIKNTSFLIWLSKKSISSFQYTPDSTHFKKNVSFSYQPTKLNYWLENHGKNILTNIIDLTYSSTSNTLSTNP